MTHQRKIFVPSSGPPQERPNPAIFAAMGESNIYKMLEDFYSELGKSSISSMFPKDLHEASQKSAAFFVFLLGGPPLYHQKYGPPMMRQRHMPFRIDEQARQVWLKCFHLVLINADVKYNFPKEHMEDFLGFLDRFSGWMVNTKDETLR